MRCTGYFRDRALVRSSWAGRGPLSAARAGLIFVVGSFDNEEVERELRREAEQFGDILQVRASQLLTLT